MNNIKEEKKEDLKEYDIPVTWSVYGMVRAEGRTREEALKNFQENINSYDLPSNYDYIDDSFDQSGNDEQTITMMEEV